MAVALLTGFGVVVVVAFLLDAANFPRSAAPVEPTPMNPADLSESLAQIDRLAPEQAAELRRFRAEIDALEPTERREILDAIRRYRLWLRALPEGRRSEVEAARTPGELADVASRLLEKSGIGPHPLSERFEEVLQVSDLCPEPLLVTAIQVRVWFELPHEVRSEILRVKNPNRMRAEFGRVAQKSASLTRTVAGLFQQMGMKEFMDGRRAPLPALLRRRIAGDPRAATRDLAFLRVPEVEYLRRLPAGPIDPIELERFAAQLPPWVRETFDALPPDLARSRLTALHRLTIRTTEARTSDGAGL